MQDSVTHVEETGYWDLAGAGHEKCGSAGYTHPEWFVEVFLGSNSVNRKTFIRDSGEFLGYGCRVLHYP